MRELKFRALELDVGRFVFGHYFAEHGYYMNNCTPDLNNPVVRHYIIGDSGKHDICEDSVCQFTGLKDKNGVDIYEGDIVSDGLTQNNHCLQGVFTVKLNKGGFYPFCVSGWECTMHENDCEIIGNIYENPELLEQDK